MAYDKQLVAGKQEPVKRLRRVELRPGPPGREQAAEKFLHADSLLFSDKSIAGTAEKCNADGEPALPKRINKKILIPSCFFLCQAIQ
mgnify:FL=1